MFLFSKTYAVIRRVLRTKLVGQTKTYTVKHLINIKADENFSVKLHESKNRTKPTANST